MVPIRVWLFDTLSTDPDLEPLTGARVFPRESFTSPVEVFPYLVFGLGNATNEDLAEDNTDHDAERQFFQVWIHDEMSTEGGSYIGIDDIIPLVKKALTNKSSPADKIMTIKYLETSGEFSNESLHSVFRYVRFQAVLGKGY